MSSQSLYIPAQDEARWREVDAEIERLSTTATLRPKTLSKYRKHWSDWEEFCGARGVEPLEAPYTTFVSLVTAARRGESGAKGWEGMRTPTQLSSNISALRYYYEAAGVTPAYQAVENQADWQALMEGYARTFAQEAQPARPTAWQMTTDDARTILNLDVPMRPDHGHATTLLIAYLTGVPMAVIPTHQVHTTLVPTSPHRLEIRLTGETPTAIECEHPQTQRPAAWGYVMGCPTCTLLQVVSEGDFNEETTFGDIPKPHGTTNRLTAPGLKALQIDVVQHEGHSGRGGRGGRGGRKPHTIRPKAGTAQLVRDGIASTLAWQHYEEGILAAYAQARLLLTWALGMRQAADALNLRGSDVTPLSDGSVKVRLANFDQPVRIPASTVDGENVFGVAEVLTQWCRLRAAAGAGDDDAFLGWPQFRGHWTTAGKCRTLDETAGSYNAARNLKKVREWSGIPNLSWLGAVNGFIAEAASQGYDELEIAMATNRVSLEHIARRCQPEQARSAIQQFVQKRAECAS